MRGGSRPPKWVPRGTPKTRGAQRVVQAISVLQCWAQKAAQEQQRTKQLRQQNPSYMSNDVVVLDDSIDDFDVQPSTSGEIPPSLPKIPRQFPSTVAKTTKKNKSERPVSEIQLQEKRADLRALKEIHFPIAEITREWEREAVKAAVSHNLGISIPYDTSGAHIVATLCYNFLRWFPECCCLCTARSANHLEALRERFQYVGIPDTELTEIDNATSFKKLKTHQIGRLLLGSSQTLTSVCETSPEVAASKRPQNTKAFGACGSDGGGKFMSSALSGRQLIITNLGLSGWLQFGPSDPTYRTYHVSPRVGVEYWDKQGPGSASMDSSWADIWKETTRDLLRTLARDLPILPSIDPDELFYADWNLVLDSAKGCPASVSTFAFSLYFIIQAYRHLVISGPRVFYLYCHQNLNASTNEALQLQTVIASNEGFHNVYEDIRNKYSFVADNAYNVSYKEESMKSHQKWIHLRRTVEDFILTGRSIKGVVLCDSTWSARVAAESINGVGEGSGHEVTVVHAVIDENNVEDVAFRPFHKTLQGIPQLFQRPTSTIAIIRTDLPLVMKVLDQIANSFPQFVISVDRQSLSWIPLHTTEHSAMLSERYEKLRPTDGHIRQEWALNDTAARYEALSICDAFDFQYHPSPLYFEVEKMQTREYFHRVKEQSGVGDYKLNSSEKANYDRMALGTFPKPNRERVHLGELTEDQLYWNKLDHSGYGKVSNSRLSMQMLKQLTAENFSLTPAEFEYEEHPDVIEKQKQIDSLLGQLDDAFPRI
ncbi:unnamed protein product, partial [Mesorhabditis belari]|uniref:Uncharacterized protein n=1 Tax=Mesorhabditis belari TaxID=2138241 RepID=A0AAF3FDZ5_9BILA